MTVAEKSRKGISGTGSLEADLSAGEIQTIVEDALSHIGAGATVLAIVPDKTRDDNTDVLFPFAAEFLRRRNIDSLDVLIAQGTHVPMNADEKRKKLGTGDGQTVPGLGKVFDHNWSDRQQLVQVGELPTERVKDLTNGHYERSIPLSINKILAPCL